MPTGSHYIYVTYYLTFQVHVYVYSEDLKLKMFVVVKMVMHGSNVRHQRLVYKVATKVIDYITFCLKHNVGL